MSILLTDMEKIYKTVALKEKYYNLMIDMLMRCTNQMKHPSVKEIEGLINQAIELEDKVSHGDCGCV